MRLELANEISKFLHPPHLYSRRELLATLSGPKGRGGIRLVVPMSAGAD